MTVSDPRPRLAAMLAERLGPAAEALAMACARDTDPEPPPPDDRALADYHYAARARHAHLRELFVVLDWSARHNPEPAPEPEEDVRDRGEDGFHCGGEVWTGSRESPDFYAWLDRQDRREERRRKRKERKKKAPPRRPAEAETTAAAAERRAPQPLHHDRS